MSVHTCFVCLIGTPIMFLTISIISITVSIAVVVSREIREWVKMLHSFKNTRGKPPSSFLCRSLGKVYLLLCPIYNLPLWRETPNKADWARRLLGVINRTKWPMRFYVTWLFCYVLFRFGLKLLFWSVTFMRELVWSVEIELSTPCRAVGGSNPYQIGHKPFKTHAKAAQTPKAGTAAAKQHKENK